jgi:sugar lactone lactonase YvrE
MDGTNPMLRSALGLFRESRAPAAESMWWSPGGGLYWCIPEAGTLHFSALGAAVSGAEDKFLQLPPLLAAFAPAPQGFVIAGRNAVALVGATGAFLRTIARIPLADEHVRFGEGRCDPFGRFVIGTSGVEGFSNGSVYSVDPSGEWRAVYEHAGRVTGMQWSDDGSRMWFMDTGQTTIYTCEYSARGEMRNVQPLVRGVRGEGLARDSDGGLWSSADGGTKVARWDANGRQTLEFDVPVRRVSSVEFGGAELSTLFIASSRVGLTNSDLSGHPLTGSIFGIETAVRGYPTRPFGSP